MKISNEYPPNYKDIKKHLPSEEYEAVFCYGDTIYNPKNLDIPEDVIYHEFTHSIQQGKNPKAWWNKYLKDPEFRLNQEIQAFAAQYDFVRRNIKHREAVYYILLECAKNLSSPLYGSLIKPVEAKYKIKEYADRMALIKA